MDTITEGSTAWLTVSFADNTGAAVTPSSATWTALDEASRTVVSAAAPITGLASSVTVEIPAAVNQLVGAGHYETRVIQIRATYGGGRAHNSEFRYQVANLL